MEVSEELKEKNDRYAVWVKGTIERLRCVVSEKTMVQIMEIFGYNCTEK